MGLSAISLFSGAGGLDLAARRCGIRTVCYVEWDRYAQAVLMSRVRDKQLDDAPIWDDVTTFDGKPWRGKVDIVFGGFPCQPHSVAGKRGGASDERNLWPDTVRILRECGAWGFVGENVPGIVTNGFAAQVMADLEREGFCGAPFSNTACAVGAPHSRERVFFLAHASKNGLPQRVLGHRRKTASRLQVAAKWGTNRRESEMGATPEMVKEWGREIQSLSESPLHRAANGLAHWMDRVGCCGNGVVPVQAVPAFERLIKWAYRRSKKEVDPLKPDQG